MTGLRLGLVIVWLACMTAAGPLVVTAAESGPGIISGQIVNNTSGGQSVADITVSLLMSRSSGAFERTETATSDEDGRFTFNGLETGTEVEYRIVTEFQGVLYYADDVTLSTSSPSGTIHIDVYDTTSDKSVIRIETGHLIALVEGDFVRVQEAYVFVNSSDKTYTGPGVAGEGHPGTLVTSVPKGAVEVEPGDGLQSFRLGTGETVMLYLFPVMPGKSQVLYAYGAPLQTGEVDLATRLYYPADSYRVLVQGNGVRVAAPQLEAQEPLDMGGKIFMYYLGRVLPADSTVGVKLSITGPDSNKFPFVWILVAVGLAGLVAAVMILVRRSRQPPAIEEDRQDKLISRIAQLDDDFAAGQLGEEEYWRERESAKQELKRFLGRPGSPDIGRH